MMKSNHFRTTLILDKALWDKFRYVANYNDRTASEQMRQLIKIYVQNFETEIGEITPEDLLNL